MGEAEPDSVAYPTHEVPGEREKQVRLRGPDRVGLEEQHRYPSVVRHSKWILADLDLGQSIMSETSPVLLESFEDVIELLERVLGYDLAVIAVQADDCRSCIAKHGHTHQTRFIAISATTSTRLLRNIGQPEKDLVGEHLILSFRGGASNLALSKGGDMNGLM